ncbi:MAG: nucleotidyltransferase domain-containing protein [Ruminococcus sp.]|nr:nucleotidyltransferase domain-containing protein [Ruminococcus sp.]
MELSIKDKLCEIERKENVRIIYAAESGSRAWGFASPDSDYDVRFVYVRPLEDYLKLEKTRDVIESQLDEVYDISGWDLQKTLRLLYNSNPTVFEWAGSPIVYRDSEDWQRVRGLMGRFFKEKTMILHYLGIAGSHYEKHLKEDMVTVKKYFYALRPLLCTMWIRDRHTPPPVPFSELTDSVLPQKLREDVDELVRLKVAVPETGKIGKVSSLNSFIESGVSQLKAYADSLAPAQVPETAILDDLFVSLVKHG